MTRKEELDIQRYTYNPNVWDLVIKDFRPGMQPSPTGDWVRFYDVEFLVKQVEREALGRMRKAVVQKQSSIHPEHTLEFKSGAGNVLYDLEQWLDAQQQELT